MTKNDLSDADIMYETLFVIKPAVRIYCIQTFCKNEVCIKNL